MNRHPALVLALVLACALSASGCRQEGEPLMVDALFETPPLVVRQVYGLGKMRLSGCSAQLSRPGQFPLTSLAFESPRAREARCVLSYVNVVPGQYLALWVNFRKVAEWNLPKELSPDAPTEVVLPVRVERGLNVVTLSYLNTASTPDGHGYEFGSTRLELVALRVEAD